MMIYIDPICGSWERFVDARLRVLRLVARIMGVALVDKHQPLAPVSEWETELYREVPPLLPPNHRVPIQ